MAIQYSNDGNWKLEQGNLYENNEDSWIFTFNPIGAKHVGEAIGQLKTYVQGKNEDNFTDRELELAEKYGW